MDVVELGDLSYDFVKILTYPQVISFQKNNERKEKTLFERQGHTNSDDTTLVYRAGLIRFPSVDWELLFSRHPIQPGSVKRVLKLDSLVLTLATWCGSPSRR